MRAMPAPQAPPAAGPLWSTTSVGDPAETQPAELTTLGEHVGHCRAAGSRFGGLRRGAQVVHGLVATRFVTTLALVVAVLAVVLLVF